MELELRRRRAELGLSELDHTRGARAHARRVIAERRKYAADPWAYFGDILGIKLTPQQEEAVHLFTVHDRLLLPSANNVGKTMILAGLALHRFDAVAALPDPSRGLEQQGARILLPGPDAATVASTIYAEMLELAERAESRGHLLPGVRSQRSVLWRGPAPKWEMEAFSPPDRNQQTVAHTASGRHHSNQAAFIEEGQGVRASLWNAVEGMCSSEGNKIVSSFNPTEVGGPAWERCSSGAYHVYHMTAFAHPNVRQRENVIRAAIDFRVIDGRVRTQCKVRGPYPGTPLEPEFKDFVYALPPRDDEGTDLPEAGPRDDGHPGHAAGELQVFRPSDPAFVGQVLGDYPEQSDSSLFDTAALNRSVQRWKAGLDPQRTPDRVGVDVALEGPDSTGAAPCWGDVAPVLLRAFAEAQLRGDDAIQRVRETRRARVGWVQILPKGRGIDTAITLDRLFTGTPFVMDEGGPGNSPYDHLERVLGRQVTPVQFGGAPPVQVPGETVFCENVRASMFVRLAMLVARDLIDLPDDPLLIQELLHTQVEYGQRSMPVQKRDPRTGALIEVREQVRTVRIIPKEQIKKLIGGRSPDRADCVALAVWGEETRRRARPTYTGHSSRSTR